ncbi:hypothetical protein CSX04_02385 [Burkholderia cepacia]|nr:hypothetical protein CSX04_02385 [Burkholderia cepacia]
MLADRGSSVGGLIGENAIGASVEHSSATGSAAGGHDSYVGGLVGFNSGMVASSSAAGTVSGGYYARLGGLAGANFGTFDNATTATRVALTPGYRQQAGAFAALNFGLFKGSSATGAAAGMPLANLNYGQIRD